MNRQTLVALASGIVFGLGLAVSQMVNPAKVLAFLDVAGDWDPSLALVMASALLVMGGAWRLQAQRQRDGAARQGPGEPRREIDPPLVIGALVFGVGWGLVGYCPGPVLAALPQLSIKPLVFVGAMLVGMGLYQAWQRSR